MEYTIEELEYIDKEYIKKTKTLLSRIKEFFLSLFERISNYFKEIFEKIKPITKNIYYIILEYIIGISILLGLCSLIHIVIKKYFEFKNNKLETTNLTNKELKIIEDDILSSISIDEKFNKYKLENNEKQYIEYLSKNNIPNIIYNNKELSNFENDKKLSNLEKLYKICFKDKKINLNNKEKLYLEISEYFYRLWKFYGFTTIEIGDPISHIKFAFIKEIIDNNNLNINHIDSFLKLKFQKLDDNSKNELKQNQNQENIKNFPNTFFDKIEKNSNKYHDVIDIVKDIRSYHLINKKSKILSNKKKTLISCCSDEFKNEIFNNDRERLRKIQKIFKRYNIYYDNDIDNLSINIKKISLEIFSENQDELDLLNDLRNIEFSKIQTILEKYFKDIEKNIEKTEDIIKINIENDFKKNLDIKNKAILYLKEELYQYINTLQKAQKKDQESINQIKNEIFNKIISKRNISEKKITLEQIKRKISSSDLNLLDKNQYIYIDDNLEKKNNYLKEYIIHEIDKKFNNSSNYIKFNDFYKFLNEILEETQKITPQISKLKKLIQENYENSEQKDDQIKNNYLKSIDDINEIEFHKKIIINKASYNEIILKRRILQQKILYSIKLSFFAISFTLLLFKIAIFYKTDNALYNLSFFEFFNYNIPLLNNSSFWFTTCVISSLCFSICSSLIEKHGQDYKIENNYNYKNNNSKNKIKKLTLFLSILGNLIKDFVWAIIVSIMTYGNIKKNKTFFYIIIGIFCASFISLKLLFTKIDLFNPIINNNEEKKINQAISSIKQIDNSKLLKENSTLKNILNGILYIFILIFCSNNTNRNKIDPIKFFLYLLLCIFFAFIIGIIGYFARSTFADFISKFDSFKFEIGFFIEEKYIHFINNKNGMLFICFFDCLIGIICAMILHHISSKTFIWLYKLFQKNSINSIIINEFENQELSERDSNKSLFSELSNYVKFLIGFIIKIPILILYTFCFHIITQIKESMFIYNHDSIFSLVINSCILVFLFSSFLIINNSIDSSLYGNRCPCKQITVTNENINTKLSTCLYKEDFLKEEILLII